MTFKPISQGPDELKKGIIDGAAEYLKKPFTNNDLVGAVARSLNNFDSLVKWVVG
jgi:FixJ family two-component response regulator